MKKPVVDYRRFRLSRLNRPEFAHLKYLLGWVVYLVLYLLTENLIPASACHPVHCALDDMIPFCEVFVLPYVFWYGFIAFSLVYFALYEPDSFKRLMIFIIVTQLLAMAIYIIWPSRQDLRPESFARDNILTRVMGFIYSIDTNTGVCPSLHVAWSLGMASVWLKSHCPSRGAKLLVALAMLTICVSVMFVKQHSALDVLAALPLCLPAEWAAYGKSYWLPRFKKKKDA